MKTIVVAIVTAINKQRTHNYNQFKKKMYNSLSIYLVQFSHTIYNTNT